MATDTPKAPRKTAADILAIDDTPTLDIFVAEWDTEVTVRGLTKRQQVDIRTRALRDGEPDPEMTQRFMWLEGVVNPVFTEEQLGPLFEKNAGAVDQVLNAILRLSGMDQEALKRREAAFRPGTGPKV